jgi:ankyrin repeat protein
VKLLIEKGADVRARTSEEHGLLTPLHAAAEFGHTAVVEALLDPEHVPTDQRTDQLNAKNKNGSTPLHAAAEYGHDAVVKALLGDPVTQEQIVTQVNAQDKDGWTPLYIAAQYAYTAVVQLLLEKGAQVDAMSSDRNGNWTPLHLVVYRQVDNQDQKPTIEGATETTRALLEKLREKGIDIQAMLQGGVIRTYDGGKEFGEWLDLVRKPENKWYRDALQGAGVDVDNL